MSQVHTQFLKFIFIIWTTVSPIVRRCFTETHITRQASASKSQPNISISTLSYNFKILTEPSFRISTKIKLHKLYKTSAANAEQTSKSCLNFSFKILTNPCAQSLNKSLALGPNVSSQICINMILSVNISNSISLNKFWVGIFTRWGHVNQVY